MRLASSEHNDVTGITTEYWIHPRGKKVTIRRVQDAEPILIHNQAELNAKSSKGAVGISSGLGVKVASIPMGLVEEMASKGLNLITCSEQDMKKFLNDPDYRKVRTAHGRL